MASGPALKLKKKPNRPLPQQPKIRSFIPVSPLKNSTQKPFEQEVPLLIANRGVSVRTLAGLVDVDPTFLSRAIRGEKGKVASVSLISKVARALDLPEDYFVELRVARVVKAMEAHPRLREEFYREVVARRK